MHHAVPQVLVGTTADHSRRLGTADAERRRACALFQHQSGQWGEVDESDWQANDEALQSGDRLLSAYRTADEVKFWVITEYDRSVTTILLPDESLKALEPVFVDEVDPRFFAGGGFPPALLRSVSR